jgi:hypothetical protein
MSSTLISAIVFGCVFAGAVVGMFIRTVLPENHVTDNSKDVVKLGMGLVATMSALVLSLLISSAKNSYDAQNTGLTQSSAQIVVLDRILAHYGPETDKARAMLRAAVVSTLNRLWGKESPKSSKLEPPSRGITSFEHRVQCGRNTLAPVRTNEQLNSHAYTDDVDCMADNTFLQFWVVCALQCHCHRQLVDSGVVRLRCTFPNG